MLGRSAKNNMLDLDHPETRFIFAIAREDDAILSIAKRMTLVSLKDKLDLHKQAKKHISSMRSILVEGWKKSKKKSAAIDLLATQVQELAKLNSSNDFIENWRGKLCTVCNTPITNLEEYEDMLYCRTCLDTIEQGRTAVDQAFNLYYI